jgi:hypothetical protein
MKGATALAAAMLAAAALLPACGGGGSGSGLLSPSEAGRSEGAAPEFPSGHTWFNVPEPLTMSELRGKAVLLDFWTPGASTAST